MNACVLLALASMTGMLLAASRLAAGSNWNHPPSWTCASSFFMAPQVLSEDGSTVGLSFFIDTSALASYASVGELMDSNITRGLFVVGCKNKLVWRKSLAYVHTDAVILLVALCDLEIMFHEVNMHYFYQPSPCVLPSSMDCTHLLHNEFVCTE